VTRTQAVVGGLVALALASCGTADGVARGSASVETPESRRGPVSLEDSQLFLVLPDELSVDVPSCHGDPELVQLVEDLDAVHLEVVTTQVVSGPGDLCLDGLQVTLETPLGDRGVVDIVSGARLTVVDQTEVLACSDIEYPLAPTFETPEEALADALREQPSSSPVPDRVDAYVRDDRQGQVFFEHIVDVHHVLFNWGLAQDVDGRWGVVSLGGCF
jgi:hypothetical protein